MSNALTQEGRLVRPADVLTLSLAGDAGAMVQIADTFTGTLAFLATADGQNYVAMAGTPVGGGAGVTTATVGGIWTFSVGGLLALRVSATALSAGAARVTMRAVEASGGGWGGGGGTALLPTAAVNQMIISQGVGVQPIFSAIAECGTFRTHDWGNVICTDGQIQGPQYLVVPAPFTSLGSAVGIAGTIKGVNDSTTIVWGASVTIGGGTNNVLVRSNGTNWTVVGM